MSVFNTDNKKFDKNRKMFLDEAGGLSIARYDQMAYPIFDKLTEKQLGFFWRPQEVELTKDIKDFRDLSEHEKHIFTSNLKRQILLDSVQGRGPVMLLPIITVPELETYTVTWTFSEQIHSKSYTHIIRNVYADPSIIFDSIMDIQEVVDCAKDVSKYYDDLNDKILAFQMTNNHTQEQLYDLKKSLWLCLHSINALEGVRFYVSFACSWAFAELGKMEGNAKIIKLICRDENLHLAGTQNMIATLPKIDDDFAKIRDELHDECVAMFVEVVDQEKLWADYLFKDGSMIGLNADILKQFVEWTANKRMRNVALKSPYDNKKSNPLPWTQKWIAGADVQVAPQETEITSYTIGAIKQDVDEDTFKDFEL